ncbi:MAG: PRC-barrel domain-containing protein [Chroococcidiopsidaceae cyanobacterium CP_BM_ER_R8_30]|nr:PRC-barrel domain-containing protein [Chroococcidiopsidaceae cyanobacterium CP_BM_ER_R8_30]
MRKGSEVIGKVVVAYDTGKRIARIWDLIFDQNSNQLLGFLVEEGGWLSSARVIPFDRVQALGTNAAVVPSKEAIVRARRVPEIRKILRRNNVLRGTRIMTVNGRDLGTMVDLYFNDETGVVEGYEVSGGLFADAYSGRSFVPAPHTLKIGYQVAFVPVETADLMAEQVGGIQGVAQTASDNLHSATRTASSRLQETTESTTRMLQGAGRSAVALFTNPVIAPVEQKAFLIGKTVGRDVTAPNGLLLAAEGQQVTPLAVEAAERVGVFDQLYQAAGGSLAVGVGSLHAATDTANQKLQDNSRQIAASFTNTLVDPAQQKVFVIDQIAEQDVVTPEGTMLVAQGQPVTLAIADAAERLGVLDQLYRATGGSLTAAINCQLTAARDTANKRFQEASLHAAALLTNSLVEPAEQRTFVVGKVVEQDVFTPDGALLVEQGQPVTILIAEEAEQLGMLDQLYRTTGGSLTAALNRQLQTMTAIANSSLQSAAGSATAALTNALVEPAEQKAFAIGKIVIQDVTAPDGTVLVVQGQQVTPLVAAEAERWGVLDQLYRATGGSLTVGLSRAANDVLASRMVEQALGLRLRHAVRSEEGSIIGAPGQIVTEQIIARARLEHKEIELMDAGGLTTSEALRSSANNLLSQTSGRLREGTVQARTSAESLLESLKEAIADLQQRSTQAIEVRRLKRALGRPVTRVILDQQDDVILNVGELITHRAIERARQAGVLDILLNSVYVKDPKLSTEALRAPERGQASLEERDQTPNSNPQKKWLF